MSRRGSRSTATPFVVQLLSCAQGVFLFRGCHSQAISRTQRRAQPQRFFLPTNGHQRKVVRLVRLIPNHGKGENPARPG